MAITGSHVILYTPEAEALRAKLRDAFGFAAVEAYDPPNGWLIFRLPPAELGVHPSDGDRTHQLWFMCDDIGATVEEIRGKGVEVRGEPAVEEWGVWTTIVLPGEVEIMLYEPRHQTAI